MGECNPHEMPLWNNRFKTTSGGLVDKGVDFTSRVALFRALGWVGWGSAIDYGHVGWLAIFD